MAKQGKGLAKLNTEIRGKNADMKMALSALEESQEENTRMMKIVVHDLRNPMAAAVSIITLLLENERLQPEDKEMLELMRTPAIIPWKMIADLLNLNTSSESLKKRTR